jgi:hypothetical protein
MFLLQENRGGELVYADIGGPKPMRAPPQATPAAEDKVVYSAIDTKATARQQQKNGTILAPLFCACAYINMHACCGVL